jgi:tetrahydromethanopterin S-methyltransferase subunit F
MTDNKKEITVGQISRFAGLICGVIGVGILIGWLIWGC